MTDGLAGQLRRYRYSRLRDWCEGLLWLRGVVERGQERIAQSKKPRSLMERGFSDRSLTMTYSHIGNPTLPSAMLRFTSEFGKGSGGSTALLSSGKLA